MSAILWSTIKILVITFIAVAASVTSVEVSLDMNLVQFKCQLI